MWKHPKFFLFLLCGLYLLQTAWVCFDFLFKITDSDQTIQWLGLHNYSQGIFHEPYYYGQNYNLMAEAWLGIPLHWAGLPLQISLVIATKLLWTITTIWLSFTLFKRQFVFTALSVLGLSIAMPLEWHILTGVPRGFIQGVSVGLAGVIIGWNYLTNKKWWNLAFSVLLMISGVLLNPNAALLFVAPGLWILMRYKLQLREIVIAVLSTLPPLILYFLASNFYRHHADYVLHTTWHLQFTVVAFLENMGHIVYLFKGLFPWIYEGGLAFIGLWLILMGFAWKKSKNRERMILMGMVLTLVATLFLNKLTDGSGSIFFPFVRMYIALFFWYLVPVMMIELKWLPTQKSHWVAILMIISLASFVLFFAIYSPRKNRIIKTGKGTVDVISVKQLASDCEHLNTLLRSQGKNLLVILGKSDAHNYGCAPTLSTFHPDYERRTWIYHQYIQHPVNQCLFLDRDNVIPAAIRRHRINARLISEKPYKIYAIHAPDLDVISLYQTCDWRILGKR